MKIYAGLFTLALVHTLGSCGESVYPIETNSINSYASTSIGHPTYNTKWTPETPADPETFSVQTGYEGFLVPSEPPLTLLDIIKTAGLVTLLPPLSKIGLKLALKVGVWGLGLLGLFLFGSIFTSAVCTLTPLCTISFLGLKGFNKETVRSLISEEKLNTAAQFIAGAIQKYKEINKGSQKKENNK